MDAGRLIDNKYLLDEKTIAGMSISKKILKTVKIGSIDMSENLSRNEIRQKSIEELKKLSNNAGINLNDPDMEKDLIINLAYGLNSATPYLEGQTNVSIMLQAVGWSSGVKTDSIKSDVVCNNGVCKLGAFALIKLQDGFIYKIGRVSSFDNVGSEELKVTKLKNPRHIIEFNGKPAVDEYLKKINYKGSLNPEVFASYTLGLEPGNNEKLITSIMKDDGEKGLITYNDVVEGTSFKLFKARSQKEDREKQLEILLKSNIIGYISFDCILCYLARNTLNQVNTIADVYSKKLPNIPKIGFGTFSENICGANVNQTETYLAILKA